jgi:uncharacterized membrane protein
MFLTAALSFAVRTINPGQLSPIHILSAWTLLQVPLIVLAARRHNLRRHRNAVRAMATGALLVAGIFTLVPDRLLGHWLYGRPAQNLLAPGKPSASLRAMPREERE